MIRSIGVKLWISTKILSTFDVAGARHSIKGQLINYPDVSPTKSLSYFVIYPAMSIYPHESYLSCLLYKLAASANPSKKRESYLSWFFF
jgi:hypothetical protein